MMMEYRTLEVNLASAKILKEALPADLFSNELEVYAVVSLSGDQEFTTPVDRNGGTCPTWNFPLKLTFQESLKSDLTLEIRVRCDGSLAADKDIGHVHVPFSELVRQVSGRDGKSFHSVGYQVMEPSGEPNGVLYFSYKFGEKFTVDPSLLQYAVEYGYLPSSAKKDFRMGLRAGLLGGSLVGFLIGEIISVLGVAVNHVLVMSVGFILKYLSCLFILILLFW